MIRDSVELAAPFGTQPIILEFWDNAAFPFSIVYKLEDTELNLTTSEAKELLKFLKKHLEPKLENV